MEQDRIQALIKQCRQGNTQAFAALAMEYQPLVFRLAFRLLCDENEAKDAMQETFVKAWLAIDKYKPKYAFSTWIYKITSNTCYDRLRTMQHGAAAITPETDISSDENAETSMINKELRDLILRFTAQLTPKQKLIFTLRDLEELDIGEIEAITGLSAEKIKSNLYLARKYIREQINKTDYRP